MSALAPDYFAALSDEVPSVKVSHRRAAVSVDRTLHWLDQCLAAKVTLPHQLNATHAPTSIKVHAHEQCAVMHAALSDVGRDGETQRLEAEMLPWKALKPPRGP